MPHTSEQVAKTPLNRYLAVTLIATPANIAIISLLLAFTSLDPLVCNLLSATAVTVPSYIVCARWVWAVEAKSAGRALSFWLSSLANVAASSLAVWSLASSGVSGPVLALTPFAVYTVLWFARFALLDRVVFRRSSTDQVPVADLV